MDHGYIFIYHRIANLKHDPFRIAVNPKRFESHMGFLKDHFTIVSLAELIMRISEKKPVSGYISITFDDGYADNLYHAQPILEKYDIPATFFITAGMIGSKREFWWDELERIFLGQQHFNKILDIEISSRNYKWKISDQDTSDNVLSQMQQLLKILPHIEREKKLNELFDWAQLSRDPGRECNRVLTDAQLVELSKCNGMDIGSHSLTHSQLSIESESRQRIEITESKKILERILKKKVPIFSYPFGFNRDFNNDTIRLVKEAGYTSGISNIQGNISQNNDLYKIPRRLIRNWDISEFQKKINGFLYPVKNPVKSEVLPQSISKIINSLDNLRHKDSVYKKNETEPTIKNIFFINQVSQGGGAGNLCHSLFKTFGEDRYKTSLLARKGNFSSENIIILKSDEVHLQIKSNLATGKEKLLSNLYDLNMGIKNIAQFKIADMVHIHNFHTQYFSILELLEISYLKPVIWTLHDMHSFTGGCNQSFECRQWETGCQNCPKEELIRKTGKETIKLYFQIKKIAYQYSSFSPVAPSKWLKSKLEKSIIQDKKIHLIYNGVDEKTFKNHNKIRARKSLNLPEDKFILLFIAAGGTHNKVKGGGWIQKISDKLSNQEILILSIGNLDTGSKDLTKYPYIEDSNKLSLFYSSADLFIYPSLADNCPLVILESLACGTPVISYKTGGIPELIEHKKTGYIAEYNNLDDIINGILYFKNNPDKLQLAGKNARKSILHQFTLKKMTEKYIQLYETEYHNFFQNIKTVDTAKIKADISKVLNSHYGNLH